MRKKYGRKFALSESEERGKDTSGNFQRRKPEYRSDRSGEREVDGNNW